MSSTLFLQQLDDVTFKIVEEDPYKEYPFVYVRLCEDKCVVIDTSTGCSDIKKFLDEEINKARLPYVVICTHVHFDHIGGNAQFQSVGSEICMGDAKRQYSKNVEMLSRANAVGAAVAPFTVSRWLTDGELIYTDVKKTSALALEVIYTPGHTEDSISIFDREKERLFVGDLAYPYTRITVENLAQYSHSLDLVIERATKEEVVETQAFIGVDILKDEGMYFDQQCEMAETLMMNIQEINKIFNVGGLLGIVGGNVEEAIGIYVEDPRKVSEMFPPIPIFGPVSSANTKTRMTIACGHIEPSLTIDLLRLLNELVKQIEAYTITPNSYSDGIAVYTNETFELSVPQQDKY